MTNPSSPTSLRRQIPGETMRLTASLFAIALAATPTLALAQAAPTRAELARIDRILRRTPLIDAQHDLPEQIPDNSGADLSRVALPRDPSHLEHPLNTDIPRLRQGRVGARFWSVYVPAELQGAASAEAVHVQIALVRQ